MLAGGINDTGWAVIAGLSLLVAGGFSRMLWNLLSAGAKADANTFIRKAIIEDLPALIRAEMDSALKPIHAQIAAMDTRTKQLEPNGGSSLADRVNRIEESLASLAREVVTDRERRDAGERDLWNALLEVDPQLHQAILNADPSLERRATDKGEPTHEV